MFPYPGDPRDVYSLTTRSGSGFVDQASGELLKYQPRSEGSVFQQWIISLHTGEGLWWLGLILGVAALTVPVLSVTGITVWWQRRQSSGQLSRAAAGRKCCSRGPVKACRHSKRAIFWALYPHTGRLRGSILWRPRPRTVCWRYASGENLAVFAPGICMS